MALNLPIQEDSKAQSTLRCLVMLLVIVTQSFKNWTQVIMINKKISANICLSVMINCAFCYNYSGSLRFC